MKNINKIYIVVQNIPTIYINDESGVNTHGQVCASLGFFTDENKIQQVINELNDNYIKELKNESINPTEKDNMRFGYIVLQPHKGK